ncbi:Putative K(+)-stimulated pyrophosphate-energized sodium pump [Pontiella desulfatans]|uniref:Putative K(+)-stimulated pyrophosphate-energized sodium pump n=1 Tax=Pontiella desulfatans TaxID=2750659 RepID=A0A6C2UDI6_PONDE|nr:sodium-translocating pyrophosphatase [Pontiella desulfatans]VGO17481.1 Putative K(+)-stimulated pyrophosphate-energized sodium pump [Pontiella desulfatans]
MNTVITSLWWIAPIASIFALFFAVFFYRKMMSANEGNETMIEIAGHVREGAMAYLFRQYKVVIIVFVVLLVILQLLALFGIQNPFVPIAFLTGGFFSGLCGYIGMKTATAASSRTAQGCSEGLNRGLQVAFRSGAVMGLVVVGFGLLDICLWYLILDKLVYTTAHMADGWHMLGMELVPAGCDVAEKLVHMTTTMITFGMGASTQALFARVGGGIYTKAADVGADLVGKVEAGIPEDDPRNPATIADNVGDNVGDVAGMGADLYESYCGSILATAALGAAVGAHKVMNGTGTEADAISLVTAPMIVAGVGTILSIIGMFMVRCKEGASQKNLLKALLTGTLGSSVLIVLALIGLWQLGMISGGIVLSVISGLAAGVIIGQATEYYTSEEYKPTQGIADQAVMGPATTIIDGLATGMYSAGIPVITIVIGIICAFGFAGGFSDMSMGLYGIGFAAVGMLATLGITLATDAYGPIADNAGGNAEMAGLPPEVRERTDALDSLGNTTAATGKGFAIGSAALTAMALLAAYIEEVKIWIAKLAGEGSFAGFTAEQAEHAGIMDFVRSFELHIMNPLLLCGLFLGGMMAFVFCAMTMKAVGRAAGAMVEEVRRQFREIPGIMEGTGKPDYASCVAISTKGAQREMLVPSLLAIIIPVVTGLILGVPGVMGLLAGGLTTGFVLATMLNNAGGAWDNAKKYVEKGAHGGKGSDAHKAAVVGDTVGDPCKDTSGPSLNILIKLMTMVSVVFTPVVVKFSPVIQELLHITTK